ncbi:MAG: ChaN family lipoprotein [Cyanobacteria bacterium P01_E01_bin.43]
MPTALSTIEAAEFQTLVAADVVYLGERHDSEVDHAAQLTIIEGLYAADPDMAIALEMFQRPFQPVIDRYLAGELSEAELVEQTEYLERWGFPWEFYAPFLRFARDHELPVLALNAPSEITRQVAREGLESLEEDDFRYIPPLTEIDTSNDDYREFVAAAFGSHSGHGNFNFDNFFAAQVTWDETMALTISEFKTSNPDTQVVVLAGNGHVIYGYGIPDRVARRLGDDLTQQIVLLNPADFLTEASEAEAIADFFWYSE